MNKEAVITHMIEFIKDKEEQLQNNKLATESQIKSDIVKAIIDELDREVTHENK